MLTVACVLKSGGDYKPSHVLALRDGVARNLTLPHSFVCLSDMKVSCETIPLLRGWPGWFSKLELFRPGIFEGPVVYWDLDTIIVGSLDPIALGHKFTVLENFWRPDRIGSGMMAWDCDLSKIYTDFLGNPDRFISLYRTPEKWGDQAFIKDHTPVRPELWQRKFPGKVVSYKIHCRDKGRVPDGASVICHHGQPRPWHVTYFPDGRVSEKKNDAPRPHYA
jgi:hypothetical protein